MANQMIMPKINNIRLPDPAAQTAKFVNMMNMTRQQEAAERQAAQAAQEMAYATAEENRRKELHGPALTKAMQDNAIKALELFREQVGDVDENDIAAKEAVRADLVARIPGYDKFIPPASQWTRDTIERLMMASEKEINTLYATPVASAAVNDRTGATTSITAGGRNPRAETIYEANPAPAPAPAGVAPRTPVAPAPAAAPAAPQTPAGPVPTGKFGETRVIRPESIPLTPDQQDHIRRMQEGLGMTNTPASLPRGGMAAPTAGQMSPDMVPAILDSAVQTGVMAQIDLDQMLALAPPTARQGIMDVIRNNNISLQADAPSLAASGMAQQQPMAPNPVQRPQAQFADMRGPAPRAQTAGLDGAPPMQNAMLQSQGRTPFIARREAPLPGSAQVPLSRLGAEKTTETQAAENVRLKMAPAIAAATRKAERAVELKSEATKSKYAAEGILNDVVDRINTIDELLRNPNRFSIIGPVEGNLPRLMQFGPRADAQAAFDKIKNTATLTSLIDMRKSTETGASPVGANPTDKDAKIVEQAASKLIQTGEPSKFDAELIDMRRKLYRTYLSAQREHEGVYADVLKENPNLRLSVPKVSDRYLSTKDMPKQKTRVKTPTSRLSAETRAKYGL